VQSGVYVSPAYKGTLSDTLSSNKPYNVPLICIQMIYLESD